MSTDIYIVYIIVWVILLILLAILFRVLPPKMKEAKDMQTKNSLFTILMIFAIPLILLVVIAPIVIVAGDENMPGKYKYAFGVIALVVVAYILYLQRSKRRD